jgi:hypothetical protein
MEPAQLGPINRAILSLSLSLSGLDSRFHLKADTESSLQKSCFLNEIEDDE